MSVILYKNGQQLIVDPSLMTQYLSGGWSLTKEAKKPKRCADEAKWENGDKIRRMEPGRKKKKA